MLIRVDHDLDKVARQFGRLAQGKVPQAATMAINVAARMVREAEMREMRDVFDRPTKWTMNSVFIKAATPRDLSAIVWLKDERATTRGGIPATKFLAAQIEGGGRHLKAFELRLQKAGVMPAGYRAVPGDAAKLDAYGNMSMSMIIQIMSFFNANPSTRSNMSERGFARLAKGTKKAHGFVYFALQKKWGKLLPGIYQRMEFSGGGTRNVSVPRPVMIFVQNAQYKVMFGFAEIAQEVVDRSFPELFKQAMEYELEHTR